MSLSQHGQQTVLTSSKPHLVGLEVDPLSTDIVIYHLEVSIYRSNRSKHNHLCSMSHDLHQPIM